MNVKLVTDIESQLNVIIELNIYTSFSFQIAFKLSNIHMTVVFYGAYSNHGQRVLTVSSLTMDFFFFALF